jgi:hypothetical protein
MSYTITTKKSWGETVNDLEETFSLWGVSHYTLSGGRQLDVTLEFDHPSGKRITVTKGDQARPQDNLRAIYLALDDMRLIEYRGLSDLVGTVFLQLGAAKSMITGDSFDPSNMTTAEAFEVLEITLTTSPAVAEAAYRAKAKQAHPDRGGSAGAMRRIQRAWELVVAYQSSGSTPKNAASTGSGS